jgi:membrane protease subunit (stomatin/prohibitin family)
MGYLRTQFLEIIQWQDDSRDTLSFRYPDEDKEIKRGAKLIVRESQMAQFVYQGQFGDTFGPGTHTLKTDNIPILSTLKGWKYGFESPFKADVYFVNTRLFTGNGWGMADPIMMRDADFGMIRVGGYGTYDFRIVDPRLFLKEVVGTDGNFYLDKFAKTMLARIVSVYSEALATAKIPVLELAAHYREIGERLLPLINQVVIDKFGLEISSFLIESMNLPESVKVALDNHSSMAAVGNLNDYAKFQMAEGLSKGEGGGMAATAAQLGAGLVMGQQMAQTMSTAPGTKIYSPADLVKIMGVGESDVMAALNDGSLKGKKVGSTWIITQQSLDEFLKG